MERYGIPGIVPEEQDMAPEMAAMLACRYRPSLPVTEPLRDDFAPVERFALSLLRRP